VDSEFIKAKAAAVDAILNAIAAVEKMDNFASNDRYFSKTKILQELSFVKSGVQRASFFLDGLSARTHGCLARNGLYSVDEICAKTADQLLEIVNFGQKSLDELEIALHNIGRQLTKKECTCGL
jgi:DNA-directed RNA polymerase alpha subunit